jgi:hypothetical protein
VIQKPQQLVILICTLLVGAAAGHWMGKSDNDTAKTATASTSIAIATPVPKPSVSQPAVTEEKKDEDSNPRVAAEKKSLEEIMKERNAGTRTRLLEEFAHNIAPQNIAAALKDLKKMNGSARDLAQKLLVSRWIETDPNGALAFAGQNRDFASIASDVMQQEAAEDFQGALDRARSIQDPTARYQALRGVLSYLTDTDPLKALTLAQTMETFPGEEPLIQTVYRQWATVDPLAAAQAAQNSGETGWRSPVNQVLRNWASSDPLAAINWSSQLNDPNLQARDIAQIVRQWSRDDPSAAAGWLNSQPAGPTRDAAAMALAFSLGGSDPSAALNWAQSIADPATRDNALERLARQIMYTNPSNGAAMLQAAGVPQNLIPPPPNPNGGNGGGWRGGRRGGP